MNANSSLFAQILRLVPHNAFASAVRHTSAERHSKGFSSWDQFVAMLYCQLAHCRSLGEIHDGMRATCGKLNHLGMQRAPAKSTLAYANAHRPWQLYESLFYQLLADCHTASPGKKSKFRFKNKLFSLDATVIDLCLSLFPWASYRQTKGAVKLHLLLDHDGYLPVFADLTNGSQHEIDIAWQLQLPKGSIVAMDRGYVDYHLFHTWTQQGVFFVTRAKSNMAYRIVEDRAIPEHRNIVSDQIIRFTAYEAKQHCPGELRRIVVWDPIGERNIVLLTNHLEFGSTTIAAIYKDRWEIELFFKTLKQNLKIKTFVGTTPCALRTQIWTALIAMLLLKLMAFRSRSSLHFSRLIALMRTNLFSYRDLWAWLSNPFAVPPTPPPRQEKLAF